MHTIKKLKRTIVFILKLALFASLFGIFFGIFGINNPWLFNLSRTTGVTMVTFVVLGIALMQVYGGYAIGTQKSRPIVHSMALATIITDLVTHLQLSIMNTSEKNNAHFVYETPERLLLVILLQLVVIVFFAYFGNYIYFSLEPPEKCCVISSSRQSLGNIIPKIDRFRKQYEVDEIIRYDDPKVLDVIARNDTVFLYNTRSSVRIHLIEYCYQKQKNIYYNFEMIDVVSQGAKYVTLDDKSMVMYTAKDLTMEQRIAKRVMDLALSLVGLIVASPIMLVCAIAIKAEDGGHVFYKQKRLDQVRPGVRGVQVPHHERGKLHPQVRHGKRRPHHQGGQVPAEVPGGRAAPAAEHPQGGHDHCGPPAGDAGERGEVHRGIAGVLLPAADEGGPDGPGPDFRQIQHLPQGQACDGPDVYRELQHLDGHQADFPNHHRVLKGVGEHRGLRQPRAVRL